MELLTKTERRVFLQINNERYINQLARLGKVSSGNACTAIHSLEKKGLVFTKQKGQVKIVMLTEKGQSIQESLLKIKEDMEV